ncbi:MAG: transglutaminase-like domain-containing protein [Tissierellia bacterium]|nr:transglutaminase-like domain-containing protein [Tissierellia bacterium]
MKYLKVLILFIIFLLSFSSLCFGADIYKDSKSEIDTSLIADGIIKIRYTIPTTKKLKVIIEKDSKKYTYDLSNTGEYDVFPLQMGDGKYKVSVYENIVSNKYNTKQTININVKLNNENSPFLNANKLVNFTENSNAIKKAKELTEDKDKEIEKLDVIYDYIISNIKYDTEKAKNIKSDYLPNIDETISSNKGICFDYASIMAAMLRSQLIPAKLVTGYSTNLSVFHAWNEVYTKETGWIVLNEMYFDGDEWRLMDSTIASSAKQSKSSKLVDYTNKLIDKKYYTKQFEY